MTGALQVVSGADTFGEVTPGTDLIAAVAASVGAIRWPDGTAGVAEGDIIVIASTVVAKAEGRLWPAERRAEAIDAETVSVIAERGDTRIVRTRHGLVLAAAGVDASNVPAGSVLLLPIDPDASAAALRRGLNKRLGVRCAVLISDTLGRPWRLGLTDAAIGAAGLRVLSDWRGYQDPAGHVLAQTVIASADEITAAADLVSGKLTRRPVSVVRGLADLVLDEDGPGAAALIRPAAEDLFTRGTAEAWADGYAAGRLVDGSPAQPGGAPERVSGDSGHLARAVLGARRTVRAFTDQPVDLALVRIALTSALLAPSPHGTRPWRFIVLPDRSARARVLEEMAAVWRADLLGDGVPAAQVERRVARGDLLWQAPCLVLAFVDLSDAHRYSDERRRAGEEGSFLAAGGAGIGNVLITLADAGLGSAWFAATLFCPDTVTEVLGLPRTWRALGAVAIGHPRAPASPRPVDAPPGFITQVATTPAPPAATGPATPVPQ